MKRRKAGIALHPETLMLLAYIRKQETGRDTSRVFAFGREGLAPG